MRAIRIEEMGPNSRLEVVDVPQPIPAQDELLVRVVATAANRADLMQRAGHYPPPPGESETLGLEMAGVVAAAGEQCTRFGAGDRVCSLLAGGGYAEYVLIHESMAMPVPTGVSLVDAAAIPEVFMTAWQALAWHGALQEGETALIHAGASGVGTAAIQIAREILGATVLITASAPKHDLCRSLGARDTIDYRHEDFAERVSQLTQGEGADVILDFMGASYLEGNIKAAALDGRIIMLALMGGSRADSANLGLYFRKRLRLHASTLRNRPLAYKAELARAFETHLSPAFSDGRL
ncbi:MAG: NAD(P)H-quinone oxidoreductase, partial [Pseudomonadota bacterium]